MVQHDPYGGNAEVRVYECRSCLGRLTTTEPREICPDCLGPLHNLTVPRE